MKRTQSYSSISLYNKCPRQWEWRYVHRNYGPPNPSAERGTELHARLEEFFLGGPYPSAIKTLSPWQRFMEGLLKYEPIPEGEWSVDSTWRAWDGLTPEESKPYMMGKIDLTYLDDDNVLNIVDWKSGRIYEDHVKQGKAYVALSPHHVPKYRARMVYLDLPVQTKSWEYTPVDRKDIQERLTNTIEEISADTVYEPTPSKDACRYCPLSFKRGGGCTRAEA